MNDGMIRVDVDAGDVIRRFDWLPGDIQAGIMNGLRRELLLAEDTVRRRADLKFSGARSGLISRLTSHVRRGRNAMGVEAVIGFRKTRGFPYELSQEFGAKAKPGGAMAIPLSDEARRASEQGRGPRELGLDLFMLKRPGRSPVLIENTTAIANTTHYILVKSIRPRLNFRKTIMEERKTILKGAADGARRAWAGGGR